MIGRLIAATIAYFFTIGCEHAYPDRLAADDAVLVADFDRAAQHYVGKVLSVAGYLVVAGPALELYVNASTPPIQDAPIVYVQDVGLRKAASRMNFGEASILEEAGCVDQYAVVTGEVGKTALGQLGIIRIQSVRIFQDEGFSSGGEFCYSKQI